MTDATTEVYYAQLVKEESTATVMPALKEVVKKKGIFCSLYGDRASHLVYTPKAGGPPDRSHRTQIARALEQLGIELIVANSPQARGRCERLYGTWQGRLPQELRLNDLTTLEEANRFFTIIGSRFTINDLPCRPSSQERLSSLLTGRIWKRSSLGTSSGWWITTTP